MTFVKMPLEELYWNPIDLGSDESLPRFPTQQKNKNPNIDPWDLENYAYIREHLDSADLNSFPSSSEDNAMESNSTSFDYVPGSPKALLPQMQTMSHRYDTVEHGNYAAIEDLYHYDRNKARSDFIYEVTPRRLITPDVQTEFIDSLEPQLYSYQTIKRKASIQPKRAPTSCDLYDPYASKNDIYCKLDEVRSQCIDKTHPIYETTSRRLKPRNFGLSNYGHLKIDYSVSWHNLHKYIRH